MNKGILLGAAAGVLAFLGLRKKKENVSGVGAVDFPIEPDYGKGKYGEQAREFAERNGVKLYALERELKRHFVDDVKPRWVWKMKLLRGNKSYTFDFGNSLVSTAYDIPTYYDIFAALTKSDPYSFEDFCADYGYEQYDDYGRKNKKSYKTYKAVQKEWEAVDRLFGDVIDELQEIY